jgi:hypothetical protein
MTMSHEELVAKRNAIKSKGNWDSTKPFDGPKYVVSAKAKTIQKMLQVVEVVEFDPITTTNLKGLK